MLLLCSFIFGFLQVLEKGEKQQQQQQTFTLEQEESRKTPKYSVKGSKASFLPLVINQYPHLKPILD